MTPLAKRPSKVRQDGKNLVAAFHAANPPLIWKFDLERNHSFAMALQGEDGDWELGVVSPKEEFHPVARFLSREDAEEAFEKTQRALLKKKANTWRAISITAMVIIVLLALVMSWMVMLNYARNSGVKIPTASLQNSQMSPSALVAARIAAAHAASGSSDQPPPGMPNPFADEDSLPVPSFPVLPQSPPSPPPPPMKDGVAQDADQVLRSQ